MIVKWKRNESETVKLIDAGHREVACSGAASAEDIQGEGVELVVQADSRKLPETHKQAPALSLPRVKGQTLWCCSKSST